MTAVPHREGDIEEVWFFDVFHSCLPVSIVITQWGFDINAPRHHGGAVLVRVFVPRWWSAEQKNDLAQTYADIVELKAQGVPQ